MPRGSRSSWSRTSRRPGSGRRPTGGGAGRGRAGNPGRRGLTPLPRRTSSGLVVRRAGRGDGPAADECPWDQEQTHRSLATYLLEETYEALEAIAAGDRDHLREELGDLLLQVYFHARIAAEGEDGFDSTTSRGHRGQARLPAPARRSPGSRWPTPTEVDRNWDASRRPRSSATPSLDGIPRALPALAYADKVLGRLHRPGCSTGRPRRPCRPTDLGGRLLELVQVARDSGLDPEQELREAVARLIASTPLDERTKHAPARASRSGSAVRSSGPSTSPPR